MVASTISSSSARAPRNRCGRDISTSPALKASPRSTRGTTRTIAYSKGLRASGAPSREPGTLCLLDEGARRRQARDEIVDIRTAVRVGIREAVLRLEPHIGNSRGEPLQHGT